MLDELERVVVVVAVAEVVAADADVAEDVVEFDLDTVAVDVFDTIVCWPIDAIDDMLAICIVLSPLPQTYLPNRIHSSMEVSAPGHRTLARWRKERSTSVCRLASGD